MAEAGTDSVDVARNSIFDPPQEEQVFFYHKDHLGSTLCITDLSLPGKTIGIPTGIIPTHTIDEFLKHKLLEL